MTGRGDGKKFSHALNQTKSDGVTSSQPDGWGGRRKYRRHSSGCSEGQQQAEHEQRREFLHAPWFQLRGRGANLFTGMQPATRPSSPRGSCSGNKFYAPPLAQMMKINQTQSDACSRSEKCDGKEVTCAQRPRCRQQAALSYPHRAKKRTEWPTETVEYDGGIYDWSKIPTGQTLLGDQTRQRPRRDILAKLQGKTWANAGGFPLTLPPAPRVHRGHGSQRPDR